MFSGIFVLVVAAVFDTFQVFLFLLSRLFLILPVNQVS